MASALPAAQLSSPAGQLLRLCDQAEQGSADAMWSIGDHFFYGICVEKDSQRAVQLYQEAAQAGSIGAKYDLCLFYAHGIGVTQDPRRAARMLVDVASLGDADKDIHGARTMLWLGSRALGNDGYYDNHGYVEHECCDKCGVVPSADCVLCHALVALSMSAIDNITLLCYGTQILRGYDMHYIDLPAVGGVVEATGLTSATGDALNGRQGVLNGRPCPPGHLSATFPPPPCAAWPHDGASPIQDLALAWVLPVENLQLPGAADEVCMICFGPLRLLGLLCFTTPCRHRFHARCLIKWICQFYRADSSQHSCPQPMCPSCRAGLAREDVDGDDSPLWDDPRWALAFWDWAGTFRRAGPFCPDAQLDTRPLSVAVVLCAIELVRIMTPAHDPTSAAVVAAAARWALAVTTLVASALLAGVLPGVPARWRQVRAFDTDANASMQVGELLLVEEVHRVRCAYADLSGASPPRVPISPLIVGGVRATLRSSAGAPADAAGQHHFVEFSVRSPLTVSQRGDVARQYKRRLPRHLRRTRVRIVDDVAGDGA